MRHRVSGRSRPVVEYEPLIQLHGVVFVHASSQGQGKTSASESFLRRLPSRILLSMSNTEFASLSSPQTSGSNRSAYGA